MAATPHSLPWTGTPVAGWQLCHGKHHTDVMLITLKAMWGFWLKTSVYPAKQKTEKHEYLLISISGCH